MKYWESVLLQWESGKVPFKYPRKIKNPFLWRTNKYDLRKEYKDEFVESKYLPTFQDWSAFDEYINDRKNANKYFRVFLNPGKDTVLVVPVPRKNKDFSTLKYFTDHASITQQKALWKQVAKIVRNMGSGTYVSVHGLGVPYLHVRISQHPSDYGNSKLLGN
jgi:hypothetical protein